MAKKTGKKTGRPKKIINYQIVEKLAQIFCTQEEIARVLDISVRTLQRDDKFCRIYKNGITEAKKSLRRAQLQTALTGNSTMLIWLGKQYLGQTEKNVVDVNGDGIKININTSKKGSKLDDK